MVYIYKGKIWKTKGNKTTSISPSRTGRGWNVQTFRVKGRNVYKYRTQKARTLAIAKKVFTRQKRKYLK